MIDGPNRIHPLMLRHIQEYVDEIQELVGVNEWRITVHDSAPETEDEDTCCAMNVTDNSRVGWLYLADKFLDPHHPDIDRTQAIIHEIIHFHLEDVWSFTLEVFEHVFGEQEGLGKKISLGIIENRLEIAVDQLAWAFMKFAPEFGWPVNMYYEDGVWVEHRPATATL